MNEIFVREIPLEYSIGGLTAEDEDGNYNVYINSNHCRSKQLRSYKHEIDHIRRGHFTDQRPVNEKETEIKKLSSGGTNESSKE